MEEGRFVHKEEPFFPLMVNYVLELRELDNRQYLVPLKEYNASDVFESSTEEELIAECHGQLQIMKDMGFNSIRLCMDRIEVNEHGYFYPTDSAGTPKALYLKESTEEILAAFEQYVNIAAEMDMRIMWLLKPPIHDEELWSFTKSLLKRFSDQPALFAYDFFNEPLYFDIKREADKKNVIRVVNSWRSLMRSHAPNQLITLGLSEPTEVFRWDPSLLDVDFISFHTYHPLRVLNEIYWYSNYGGKPWMVGETGLQADGDSISYADQTQFNQTVYDQVRNCGGIGIGFWEFQEVTYSNFEGNHTGLINREGTTTSSDGMYTMKGTIKPAGKNIRHLEERRTIAPCEQPLNYYNILGYNNFVLKGRLINTETNEPIEGAVIRGWNDDWSVGMNTFSNEEGWFSLYSNDNCVHLEISAPGMERLKFDPGFEYWSIDENDIDNVLLPQRKLEYHDIDYNNSLVDSFPDGKRNIFTLKPEAFSKAKLEGNLGDLYLKPIEVSGK